jgi:hypothetical protein
MPCRPPLIQPHDAHAGTGAIRFKSMEVDMTRSFIMGALLLAASATPAPALCRRHGKMETSMAARRLGSALLIALLSSAADRACAETRTPAADRAPGLDVSAQPAAYCPQLKQVAALAAAKERFAAIAGPPRHGDFHDTTLPLPGWSECSIYARRTYTCDSPGFGAAEQAAQEQARLLHEIKACLGDAWAEAEDRSSSGYAVLHGEEGVSITISLDQNHAQEHVVRLILFLRGRQ